MTGKQKRKHRGRGLRCRCVAAAALSLSPGCVSQSNADMLEPSVVDALTLALADERGALATYEAVMTRFGEIRPFVNIAQAEQRHIEALLPLFDRYQVTVPADRFDVPNEVKTASLAEICQMGVEAEIENVRLYDEELLPAVTDYPEITSVMRALRDASANNHLPAFRRCVDRDGRPGRGQGGGR